MLALAHILSRIIWFLVSRQARFNEFSRFDAKHRPVSRTGSESLVVRRKMDLLKYAGLNLRIACQVDMADAVKFDIGCARQMG